MRQLCAVYLLINTQLGIDIRICQIKNRKFFFGSKAHIGAYIFLGSVSIKDFCLDSDISYLYSKSLLKFVTKSFSLTNNLDSVPPIISRTSFVVHCSGAKNESFPFHFI